jgi:hypothetical protein
MPSNVINRKVVREALASLIDGAFGADWDVFSYRTAPTFNKARNIVVGSAGSKREIKGADAENADTSFRFSVYVFILYQDTANGWTAQNSEDELDATEKALADLFTDNIEAANWGRLSIEGDSDVQQLPDEAGRTFRREIITVRAEIYT